MKSVFFFKFIKRRLERYRKLKANSLLDIILLGIGILLLSILIDDFHISESRNQENINIMANVIIIKQKPFSDLANCLFNYFKRAYRTNT